MRHSIITIALAAMLVSRLASAAESNKETTKGAAGPSAGPASEAPGGGPVNEDVRDRLSDNATSDKSWDVGLGLDYHHMLAPESEAINNGQNRNVNYWSLSGRWDITKYDRIGVLWGMYEYLISDQNENSVRLDDLSIYYTRTVPLPGGVTMRVTPRVNLPVSYGSQLAGIYFEPSLGVGFEKWFGRYFELDARLRGVAYIVKATSGGAQFTDAGLGGFGSDTTGGANPNPKGLLSMRLTAELSMPFHEPLSISVSGYTSYSWLYDIGCSPPTDGGINQATGMAPANGYAPASMQAGQPTFQTYGYEISARYLFPSVKGFKADASFTFAPLGDPTLGYTPVVHADGSAGVYGYYRQTAEIYASLSLHY